MTSLASSLMKGVTTLKDKVADISVSTITQQAVSVFNNERLNNTLSFSSTFGSNFDATASSLLDDDMHTTIETDKILVRYTVQEPPDPEFVGGLGSGNSKKSDDSQNGVGQGLGGGNSDGDNLFFLPPLPSITRKTIEDYFPLKHTGNFHFRFKIFDDDFGFLWADLLHETDYVPMFRGQIHIKALRLGSQCRNPGSGQHYTGLENYFADQSAQQYPMGFEPGLDTTANSNQSNSNYQNTNSSLPPKVPGSNVNRNPPSVKMNQNNSNQHNQDLLGSGNEHSTTVNSFSPSKRGAAGGHASLDKGFSFGDFESGPSGPVTNNMNENQNNLGNNKPQSQATATGPGPLPRAEDLNREQLVREREADTARNIAARAQAFRKNAKKDEDDKKDRLEAGSELKTELDSWALNPQDVGKFRDIRTLLASLQDVIWEGSTWNPVSLGDLMMDKSKVKKAWQKAILISHPDRHNNADGKRRYRAERIFEAINESFKTFKP